ncbi:MAG: FAD-dependent oxidoreductase [Caulobacterales bacterium]|nr:FAD-dependent oxidoreductase [Caulobacterales bacterium]
MTSPARPSDARVAVIGAGLAGLACAARLRERGVRATVFEKSRGLGGRLAARRAEPGLAFDHGAQFITARGAGFQSVVARAAESGHAAPWRPRMDRGRLGETEGWMVGAPGMSALAAPLADGVDVRLNTEITALDRDGAGWCLRAADDSFEEVFDIVACTAPAPQARPLAARQERLADALAEVEMAPCWALLVAFEAPIHPGFDVRRSRAEDLAWLSRNDSKPGRSAAACWVAHASPAWSERHLELDREAAASALLHLLPASLRTGAPAIRHASAHRWRYAMTTRPLGRPYLVSSDGALWFGGDWCLGARAELAFDSGRAMAEAICDG